MTQEETQQALLERMQEISENTYAAGWMRGLEFGLWALVCGDRKIDESEYILTEAELEELQELHRNAHGWWVWVKGRGSTFVSTVVWLEIYNGICEAC